ncbi:hypothetical protein DL95DRAFT_416464 [Leptodontidium sp. 2 PMI_412]|nr:hypothetical protein DL95DRAFT_416464 [Leptodontidium sp. 2 PMI_412]
MTSTISPVAYPRFSDHPAEIQKAIWRFSLPLPRVIQLQIHADGTLFISNATPPAALHACFDSRKEALKRYSPMFESTLSPYSSRKSKRPIYVDLTRDIIYVVGNFPETPLDRLNTSLSVYRDMETVTSVAFDLLGSKIWSLLDENVLKLKRFKNLKNIWVVVGRDEYKNALDFRTGAHLELEELHDATANRATDSQGVFLEEWITFRNKLRGSEEDDTIRNGWGRLARSDGQQQPLQVKFAEVALVMHTPTYGF